MAESFLILYAVFMTAVFLSKSKSQALVFNTLCCIACGTYLYMNTGYAGTIAYSAAAMGSMFQLYVITALKQYNQKKLMHIKLAGCVIFATIGIIAVYKAPIDLCLIFAVLSCRCGEILPKNHQVKLGFALNEVLWVVYAAAMGLSQLFMIEIVISCIAVMVIANHYFKTHKEWTINAQREILFLMGKAQPAKA